MAAPPMSPRLNWDRLPHDVRMAVGEHTGAIEAAEPAEFGYTSQVAVTLRTASGAVFVKGLRQDHPWIWTQAREAAVNPHVQPVAPRLRWRVVTGGWDLLGFEHVAGEPADIRPGSADLPGVVEAMSVLGTLTGPARGLADAAERWKDARFAGGALLHTDWHQTNTLVTPDGVRLVDWAAATRGAAWIDPACWIVWLIHQGHGPRDAESWAARVPAYSAATAEDLDLFATALARDWQQAADASPSRWTSRLRDAAAAWDAHRKLFP
jgi:hypothetical protein